MIAQLAIDRHHEQAEAVAAQVDEARQADLLRLADLLLAGDPDNADEVAHVAKDRLQLTDAELVEMGQAVEQGRRLCGQAMIAERAVADAKAESMRLAQQRHAAKLRDRLDEHRKIVAENVAALARGAGDELVALAERFPSLFDRSHGVPRLRGDDAETLADSAYTDAKRRRLSARLDRVERELAVAERSVDRGDVVWKAYRDSLRVERRRLSGSLDKLTDSDDAVEDAGE